MTTTVVRPLRCCGEPPGDAGLGVGVDGARRLDEDEHVGVAQQRPGEGEPLALAAGERAAALLELAVEAAVDRGEGIVGVGDVEGGEPGVVVGPAELSAQRSR